MTVRVEMCWASLQCTMPRECRHDCRLWLVGLPCRLPFTSPGDVPMNSYRSLVVAALLCLPAHTLAQDKKPDSKLPKEIDPATIEAWKKRGFIGGWISEQKINSNT